jgi:hypothetical protein
MATREQIDQQYRATAIIAAAMIMGQLIFAGVSWFLHGTDEPTQPLLGPLVYAWIAVAITAVPLALLIRQKLVGLGDSAEGLQAIRDGKTTMANAQTWVIVMFALLEGAGLLGLLNYFVNPYPQLLVAVLVYIIACAIIFFPRRDWLEPFYQG